MKVKKIGLIGGRGYVGQEILKLLANHKFLKVTSAFSSSKIGHVVNNEYDKNLIYKEIAIDKINLVDEDAYILALQNNESHQYVDLILKHNSNAIIIDISSDHRFDNEWDYRVPELSSSQRSLRISNPGCYATAMQLMLEPIKELLEEPVHFFGISGYSGAGASPNKRNNLKTLKDNILPYSLVSHLHEQEVKVNSYPKVLFTPHVGNFFRGMLITGNFEISIDLDIKKIENLFINFFKNKPLIFIEKEVPNLQMVQNTSKVIIGGFDSDKEINRLTFCCALDNLLKGAATQVVQNLNSSFGWEDNIGIIQ